MTARTRQAPADWLISQYDKAELDTIGCPDQHKSVIIQPMCQLKSAMDAGQPMRVLPGDYLDLGRWWL